MIRRPPGSAGEKRLGRQGRRRRAPATFPSVILSRGWDRVEGTTWFEAVVA